MPGSSSRTCLSPTSPPHFAGGNVPTESLSLKFSRVRWRYTRQRIDGGSGNTAGGWDLATNRIA